MATDSVVLPNLKNAFSVFFANLHIALVIGFITGGLGFVATEWGGNALAHASGFTDQRGLMVTGMLTQSMLLCFWAGTVGAWAAPAQIYLWVQREKKQEATLSGAINYGLNRLGRVMGPHFSAYALIALGNIVIVPGIIFGLQYAFVDAIATLDPQEKRPLARSARLTSARRATIFRTMLVFTLGWWLWFQLAIVFLMPAMPWWGELVAGTLDHCVLILVDLCMVQYYLDMFRKPAEAAKLTNEPLGALPASTTENPWAVTSPDSEPPTS